MADMKEKLEDMLNGFLAADQARQAADDIRSGDRLMRQYPAPLPSADLLRDINSKVSRTLRIRRLKRVVRSVAAVAAVFVLGGMLLFFSGDEGDRTVRHVAVAPDWWDDSAVETLTAEVDDVVRTMISISIDDTFVDDHIPDFDEAELEELEAIAMSDDFWKG